MKKITIMILMLALTAVYGCQSPPPRGGGTAEGKGFTVTAPTIVTQIRQGETKSITVFLERARYFKQNVKLQIEAHKGIQIEPSKITISSSDKPEVRLVISADKDSALGEYRVSVAATPEQGEPTSTVFNIKVVSP